MWGYCSNLPLPAEPWLFAGSCPPTMANEQSIDIDLYISRCTLGIRKCAASASTSNASNGSVLKRRKRLLWLRYYSRTTSMLTRWFWIYFLINTLKLRQNCCADSKSLREVDCSLAWPHLPLLTVVVMSPAAAAAMKHFLAPPVGPVYWFAPVFSASGRSANYGRWAAYFS